MHCRRVCRWPVFQSRVDDCRVPIPSGQLVLPWTLDCVFVFEVSVLPSLEGRKVCVSDFSALYNLVEVKGLFLRERAGSFYSSVDLSRRRAALTHRPQAWLLSRILFDVIPLRLIPTILVR